jgi:hypothetical protein
VTADGCPLVLQNPQPALKGFYATAAELWAQLASLEAGEVTLDPGL